MDAISFLAGVAVGGLGVAGFVLWLLLRPEPTQIYVRSQNAQTEPADEWMRLDAMLKTLREGERN